MCQPVSFIPCHVNHGFHSCLQPTFPYFNFSTYLVTLSDELSCLITSSIDYPLHHNVQQNVPVPVANNPFALVPNILTPSRRRPARTPGLVGTSASYLVPDHVRKKFIEGWTSHVSLIHLTDKGCLFKNKSSTNDALAVDPLTGMIHTTSASLSDDAELDLTFDEWYQAWRRLLDLIRAFVPHDFHAWEIHYSFIANSENRAELWPLYLAYDAEIRRRTTRVPIDPSKFSIGIWNDLEVRYTTKKVLSLVQADLRQQTGRSAPDRQKPRNPSNNHSFRDQHSHADSSKIGRCIFCGDRTKTHMSRNCTAACYANGVPCHLHRVEPSGTRQSRSGKRYCYAWNGLSGCEYGATCRRGEHLCTLCGSNSHNAQQCNAVA